MPNTYSLLCYTREATGREEANNEDIAYSMHLALRLGDDDGARWRPLNENYGIFVAAGVPIAAVPEESRRACTAAAQYAADPYEAPQPASEAVGYGAVMPGVDITLKSLKDPFLFRLADGRFGIAATRTDRGGAPDGSERSAFLVAVSRDLTSFEQLGLVRLRTDSGVNRVSVAYLVRRIRLTSYGRRSRKSFDIPAIAVSPMPYRAMSFPSAKRKRSV